MLYHCFCNGSNNGIIVAQVIDGHVFFTHAFGENFELLTIWYDEGHQVIVEAISHDADVIDEGTRLQLGFDFSKWNVFSVLKFDKIFLPVCKII